MTVLNSWISLLAIRLFTPHSPPHSLRPLVFRG